MGETLNTLLKLIVWSVWSLASIGRFISRHIADLWQMVHDETHGRGGGIGGSQMMTWPAWNDVAS